WALKNARSKSGLQKVMSNRQDKRKRTTEKEDWVAEEKERLAEIRKAFDINMIVAALIAAVTLAAGFTVPGGYNQSGTTSPVLGMAVLSEKPAFPAFMVSDTMALLLSCVAIFLNFWGSWMDTVETIEKFAIVTTRIVTAFSTAIYVVLAQSSALAIATCVVGVISIPISFLLCFRLGHVSL
ncbi:unnamed protein product, partial [Ilex paraguariensis]